MSFDGRLVVIMGASGGIGSALARRLAQGGAQLLLAGRNEARGTALAESVGGTWLACDGTDASQVDALFTRAGELGGVYGAVNCAGSLLLKPAHLTTDAEWQATIAQNLNTAFFLLRQAAKQMQAKGGAIVLLSSAAARTGLASHEAVAAAKAGVIGLTLSSAASYAARGIRINCVAPGLVQTPLTERITANESSLKASAAMHALGRVGQPEEIASAITWLLHPEQSWVTGQVLGVDGGLGTVRPR